MSGMVDKLDGLHVETRNLGKDLYLSRPIQHAPLAAHLRIPGEVADDRSVVALAHFVMQMTAAWPGIARVIRAADRFKMHVRHTHRAEDQDPENLRFAVEGKCRACDLHRALDALDPEMCGG